MMNNLNKWDKEQLKRYIADRIYAKGSGLSKEKLLEICQILKTEFNGIEPIYDQTIQNEDDDDRLMSILAIKKHGILSKPEKLPAGSWKDDVQILPALTFGDVFSYLILRPSITFNTETMRNWRSLDSVKIVNSGGVGQVETYDDLPDKWRFVRGKVCASQTNGLLRNVWILVHSENVSICTFLN